MEQEQTINKSALKGSFAELDFINTAVKNLPIEDNDKRNKPHRVSGFNYSRVMPTPRDNPRILSLSASALELLDLDKEKVEKDPDTPLYLSGNKQMPGSDPIAHCYCGHQFGVFAGQLGDGRAITLGDIKNQKGEVWELQFKGSGLTPYSRSADGKAVLRSSIREFLCSEAMWALGIPTSRAPSLIVTDSLAVRDPLYNGRRINEKCAIVLRLAPTFFRFGSFEIFKDIDEYTGDNGPSYGQDKEMMPAMLNHLLAYFPEVSKLEKEKGYSKEECYLEMYYEIVRRTAYLFALWQCYGFCHGVLNTDNMSAVGLTIDYGPFGWMDYFDKGFICNHSDNNGRYSYENQPSVGKWNLNKLAEALQSHLPLEKMKAFVEAEYDKIFNKHYYDKMREKLGLICVEREQDIALIDDLFHVMHHNASDFTNTFRKLAKVMIPKDVSQSGITNELIEEFAELSPHKEMIAKRYESHYSPQQLGQLKMIARNNIDYLEAMGISAAFIRKEEEKAEKYKEIMELNEEEHNKEVRERWRLWLKRYEERLALETAVLKVEEETEGSKKTDFIMKNKFDSFEEIQENRIKRMNKANPVYVLRNYVAEEAIRKAEKGDYSGVNNVLELLLNPFEERNDIYEGKEYTKCPPKWAAELCVSCSS